MFADNCACVNESFLIAEYLKTQKSINYGTVTWLACLKVRKLSLKSKCLFTTITDHIRSSNSYTLQWVDWLGTRCPLYDSPSSSGAPPPSPSAVELFLSHILCTIFCLLLLLYRISFSFLNTLTQVHYHCRDGLGLGQQWVHLGTG